VGPLTAGPVVDINVHLHSPLWVGEQLQGRGGVGVAGGVHRGGQVPIAEAPRKGGVTGQGVDPHYFMLHRQLSCKATIKKKHPPSNNFTLIRR
jgi:hypothetical protein